MASTIRGNDNFDSANVGPSTTLNDVGTYGFLRAYSGSITYSPGDTISGSTFTGWSNGYGYPQSTPTPSGTWRCMGYASGPFTPNASDTLFVRIS